MLCTVCDDLVLNLSQQNSKTQIRQHANRNCLKLLASQCAFCKLIYESAKCLDEADTLPYCKARGGRVFDEALKHVPIRVYHVAIDGQHNIAWGCSYDVFKLEGYTRGPSGFRVEGELGGLSANSGLSSSAIPQSLLLQFTV
jgi:hypothetical protein